MSSDVRGEVEKDERVLIIKRIHVTYHLKSAAENRETIERVYSFHADYCPVYRSIKDSIEITTELQIEET